MPRRRNDSPTQRRLSFEQFEKRLMMSGQAIGSLLPELEIAAPAMTQQQVTLERAAADAADVSSQYGFDGAGQTVVVIDSGIAWDHEALGGGLGADHKVVGGWDFAENDANPYDDGPAGFHGTHVSGIIGSLDDQYRGVSPGADLVALRVFTDNGEGSLEWVEQALRWVHEHKDDFANPITTVNLSLGTTWNSDSVPQWARLEDEFARLELDGLFISVAAGNSYKTFGEPGLSYPAVSPHVIPVASHQADGTMSDFSQRADGVLVAPGEMLRSTVPDHLFGGAMSGQFLGATGTSMAAPYVAGASVVLRQANEFMGFTDVTQDMLYQQFRDSAQQLHDAVTGGYYYRVNLEAALAAVVTDRHSDVAAQATDVGIVQGGEAIHGTIGKIADIDAFEFTADQTGQVTLTFETTHDLTPLVEVVGQNTTSSANEVLIDVVAGEKYNFTVGTAAGNGHYKIEVEFQRSIANPLAGLRVVDWGTPVATDFPNQLIDGQSAFKVTAARDGILTIESTFARPPTAPFVIDVYDEQMTLVHSVSSATTELRLDLSAHAGESFFLKAVGESASADFRVTSLVSVKSGYLVVHGTNQDDLFEVSAERDLSISINGVDYQFSSTEIQRILLVGHGGYDSLDVNLGAKNDTVMTRPDGVSITNNDLNLNATGMGDVDIEGGGGYDVVSLRDSTGMEVVNMGSENQPWVSLSGSQFQSRVSGFEFVYVRSTGGGDRAFLLGSTGNDVFVSHGHIGSLQTANVRVVVAGFQKIDVDGNGGSDRANLNDTQADDQFFLSPETALLATENFSVTVSDFNRINVISNQGDDTVSMHGSAGSDFFNHRNGVSILRGDGFTLLAKGAKRVDIVSAGGNDFAQIIDTAGDDRFFVNSWTATMRARHLSVSVNGFGHVNMLAVNGGWDQAFGKGTNAADVILANRDNTRLTMLNGRSWNIGGVDEMNLDSMGGDDLAFLTGSGDRDFFSASYSKIEFASTTHSLVLSNVEQARFDGNGGFDEVVLDAFEELDVLKSLGNQATAFLRNHSVTIEDFELLEARTVDDAIANYHFEAIDYLYRLRGQWARQR